ncbi:MAG: hypothetical protein RIT07_872, partial [Bacteroidota bacterium]
MCTQPNRGFSCFLFCFIKLLLKPFLFKTKILI